MNIINNCEEMLKNSSYEQWLIKFIEDVITDSKLTPKEVILDDFDLKGVYLTIDNEEYDIRTWNFFTEDYDENDIPCAEIVDYSLFKSIEDHGEEIKHGEIKIIWKN